MLLSHSSCHVFGALCVDTLVVIVILSTWLIDIVMKDKNSSGVLKILGVIIHVPKTIVW